jgi:RNA polymerase sigma-70 factor (ECF subfamily)
LTQWFHRRRELTLSEADPKWIPAGKASPQAEQFVRLLGAHERNLFAYVYALAPSWQDAEEVMQRVRIRIWQQFDQYDVEKPFEPWARAIAYYLVLAYRKEKSRQREFFTEAILESVSSEFDKHLQHADDRREALLRCLDKLDRHRRELVTTYYSATPRTSDAIAAKLSMTPNALRQAMFRIRKILHDCVARTIHAEASR